MGEKELKDFLIFTGFSENEIKVPNFNFSPFPLKDNFVSFMKNLDLGENINVYSLFSSTFQTLVSSPQLSPLKQSSLYTIKDKPLPPSPPSSTRRPHQELEEIVEHQDFQENESHEILESLDESEDHQSPNNNFIYKENPLYKQPLSKNNPTPKKTNDRTSDRTNDSTIERTNDNTIERTNNNTIERTNDNTIDRTNNNTIERTNNNTIERTNNNTIERTNDKTSDRKSSDSLQKMKKEEAENELKNRSLTHNTPPLSPKPSSPTPHRSTFSSTSSQSTKSPNSLSPKSPQTKTNSVFPPSSNYSFVLPNLNALKTNSNPVLPNNSSLLSPKSSSSVLSPSFSKSTSKFGSKAAPSSNGMKEILQRWQIANMNSLLPLEILGLEARFSFHIFYSFLFNQNKKKDWEWVKNSR